MATQPVFLPGKFHGQKGLAGSKTWDRKVGHDWAWGSEGICNSHSSIVGLELFSLWLWHCWVLSFLWWSQEILVTQAVHIPTCVRVVISHTIPSNFNWRGKQEWTWTFLKLLITAKLLVPFSHDTSNFHLEIINWFFSPSINFAEHYNCNVLAETI